MCKKLLVLTSLILLLGSFCNAEDIQWTAGGRNTFWNTAANWDLSRPPTLEDEVRLDVPAAAAPSGPIIQEGIAAQAKGIFTEAAGAPTLTMTGGTLDVAEWIWWGDGMDSYAIWTMSGGTVTVANEFELGWGGGAGTLTITGGTINAGELVVPTGSGAFGELYLYGGTVNVTEPGGLEVNANGLIDITDGTLVLEGDDTAKVNDLAAAGQITALGGQGLLQVDYDVRNPGKTTVTASAAAPGLVAYYAMENDVLDGSNNGNDGTIMGDPNFIEGLPGYGMALAFDGDGDIVDCGYDPTLAISGAVTLSAWINVNVQGLDHKVGGNQDGANGGYKMSVYNDKIEFEIRTAANSAVLNRSVEGGTILEAGVWYHVVGVYSLADGYIRTYVNGALDRELLTTEELGVSQGNFFIGCEPFNTGSYNFNGVMDEIRLYNIALSEHEIMGMAGQPVNPGADGLVANYTFDVDANDTTGNGYDGTLLGDATVQDGVLVLDGDGDAVDVPSIGSDFSELTYSMYVYPTEDLVPLQFSGGINSNNWAAGAVHLKMNYGVVNVGINGLAGGDLVGTTIVEPDKWSHIALTVSETTVKIHLNGEVEDSRALDAPLAGLVLGEAAIGAWNNGGTAIQREMAGQMDNVLIYSRGLSVGEVRYLAGQRVTPVDPGTDGLVAHYEFENNVDDSSGNGLHGTIVGDPEFVEGPPGLGMALDFDGDGDYIDCGNPPEFSITDQISFAYWIKVRAFDASWNTVIAKGDDSWRSSRAGENNFMEAAVSGTSGNYLYGVTPVDDEQWHHVTAVYDGATFKLYVDGDMDASEESTGQINVSSYSVFIGENSQATGRFWNGLIDDVVIYNRALSDGEVRYIAGYRPAPSPVGYWTLDEGAGTVILDSSGNGNDGTLVDNPVWDIAWTTGPSGGAIEFYGVGTSGGNGDYFDCGSDASLNMTGPISIALWIRPDADDPEGQATTTAPMSKTDGSDWSWQVRYGWNSPQPYMAFTFNSSPRAWAYVGQNLVQGEWCHIACSHDGATLKCYLDGAETDSTPMGQFGGVGTPVLIGTDGWGCDWIGAIDDVRIYDVGLSEAEILDVMAGI